MLESEYKGFVYSYQLKTSGSAGQRLTFRASELRGLHGSNEIIIL